MKITQHVFGEPWPGEVPEIVEFDGMAAGLLKVPFVANWAGRPEFYRFSLSDSGITQGGSAYHLMAEMKNGTEWWVVGYVDGLVPDLPTWKQPKKQLSAVMSVCSVAAACCNLPGDVVNPRLTFAIKAPAVARVVADGNDDGNAIGFLFDRVELVGAGQHLLVYFRNCFAPVPVWRALAEHLGSPVSASGYRMHVRLRNQGADAYGTPLFVVRAPVLMVPSPFKHRDDEDNLVTAAWPAAAVPVMEFVADAVDPAT